MAAADPVVPPEEVALLELGRPAASPPSGKLPAAPEEPPGDADATLPWDRCQPGSRCQAEPSSRCSPEGGPQAPREAAPSCPPPEAAAEDPPGGTPSFVPIDLRCVERAPSPQRRRQGWQGGQGACLAPPEAPSPLPRPKQLLLPPDPPRCRHPLGLGAQAAAAPRCQGARGCSPGSLQAVGAALGALLLCPCLLYGAFVFLPFDAPLLPTLSARLLYSLRCATFATVPIVLGLLVGGISQLCCQAPEPSGELRREVELHRAFVSESTQLFTLFFLNLAVLASHLPQELLKLLPLLAALFAISRLLFWLSSALGRWLRAFGSSLSLLPLLAMLLWNLYSLLVLEPHQLLALAQPQEPPRQGTAKLRLWG